MAQDSQRRRIQIDEADRDALSGLAGVVVLMALGVPAAGLVLGLAVRLFLLGAGV